MNQENHSFNFKFKFMWLPPVKGRLYTNKRLHIMKGVRSDIKEVRLTELATIILLHDVVKSVQ